MHIMTNPTHQDPIIALDRELNKTVAKARRLSDRGAALEHTHGDRNEIAAIFDQVDTLDARADELERRILSAPTSSVDGVAIKIRHVLEQVNGGYFTDDDLESQAFMFLATTQNAGRYRERVVK